MGNSALLDEPLVKPKHKESVTLRQQAFIKALPKHKYNVKDTALAVGYSENYALSDIYKNLRKTLYSKIAPEEIRNEFINELDYDMERFHNEKDNVAFMRCKELKAKCLGLQIDRVQVSGNITISAEESAEIDSIKSKLLPNSVIDTEVVDNKIVKDSSKVT